MALILLLIAGCSTGGSGSGGTNISLGLAGSTADHPSAPPSVASAGPSDAYAFVDDTPIGIHKRGSSNLTQLTHLVLSNGADIAWGPLVWSPKAKFIAFALVQNLTPTTPDRTAGPIYVVDTNNGNTVVTPGIGSIYGHNYAWFGDNMLFYSSGDGISMYDIGDTDARVWQVLSAMTAQTNQTFTSNDVVFGDIAITSDNNLYYSAASISNIGGTGEVGSAALYRIPLPPLADYNSTYQQYASNSPVSIAEWLYKQYPLTGANTQVADLGHAYSDTEGNYTMGSWQISGGGHYLVWQVIKGVNTSAQTVSSQFYFASPLASTRVLSAAGTNAQSLHGQLGLSPDSSHIAFTGDQLYLQTTKGGNSAAGLTTTGWVLTPVMAPKGSLLVATEVVSSSRDSNGVLRTVTNLVAFDGQNHYVLIAGAEDASFSP
jgi:hypothetical protein